MIATKMHTASGICELGNWTLRLQDTSPTRHFAYETVRLLNTLPMTWTFRLHDILPLIKLLDRRNMVVSTKI